MTWFLSLLTALIGAVAGSIGMFAIASQWVRWFRISSFEGGSGYYVIFLALAGGVVGGIVGLVASRYAVSGNDANFVRGVAYAAAAIVASLAFVYVASWLIADHPPTIDGRRLVIDVEIRTPPVTPLLDSAGYKPGVSLYSGGQKYRGSNFEAGSTVREEGDRRVVTTQVDLGSSASIRYLYVAFTEGCQFQVALEMPGTPTNAQFEWSEWREATAFMPSKGWELPGVDLKFAVRYRVQFAPVAPPPPTAAEREAEVANEASREAQAQRDKLAAIPNGAPIGQYLDMTGYDVPHDIKLEVYARMRASAQFAEEYASAARHVNGDTAAMWMRLATEFPGDRAPVVEAIRLAGEDAGKRIEALGEAPKVEDDGFDPIYDVLVRFGGFFGAAYALHEVDAGDFAPELRAILKAARPRQNLRGIRSDVVRVASFYLQQWAGDAPAPDDPPPS